MANQLKEILKAAGRSCDYTNRSFSCKAVNAALATGLVRIEVSRDGMVWTDKAGTSFNLKVFAASWVRKIKIKGTMTPKEILYQIGTLLLNEEVKKALKSYVHLRSADCPKCQGMGIIPHFHYYCSGICFSCGGTGRNMTNDKTTVEIIKEG